MHHSHRHVAIVGSYNRAKKLFHAHAYNEASTNTHLMESIKESIKILKKGLTVSEKSVKGNDQGAPGHKH